MFSTLNVQHLESLNDRVAELTGVRVRETMPDAVLGAADEVVLIDISPEALLERLQRRARSIPPERIAAALNDFFRLENIAALREVALRQVAEDVEARRLTTEQLGTREESLAAEASQAVGERLLALVEPCPAGQRLVRRALRSAQRLGGELDLLWVKPPGRPPSDEVERSLAALRQLASVLGAHLLIEESDDLAAAIEGVAARRGSTYMLMGRSRRPRGLARLRTPAAPAADGPAARRGLQDRRRPVAAPEGAHLIAALVIAAALLVAPDRGAPGPPGRHAPAPRGRARRAAGAPHPAAVHRPGDLASRRRRRPAARPRRERAS